MFERFTDRARKVMALANQEAQRFNHEYVGTEHTLLGFVDETTGANLLVGLGVDPRKVRLEVEKRTKRGPNKVMGKLPQTPRLKKVIEYTIEEMRNYKHETIDLEHLLVGMLREQDGVACEILIKLGLKLEAVRQAVLRTYAPPPVEESPADRAGTIDQVDSPRLVLLLDPGAATADEIGRLLFEFSTLYRMLGGSGITFTTTDAREPAIA